MLAVFSVMWVPTVDVVLEEVKVGKYRRKDNSCLMYLICSLCVELQSSYEVHTVYRALQGPLWFSSLTSNHHLSLIAVGSIPTGCNYFKRGTIHITCGRSVFLTGACMCLKYCSVWHCNKMKVRYWLLCSWHIFINGFTELISYYWKDYLVNLC